MEATGPSPNETREILKAHPGTWAEVDRLAETLDTTLACARTCAVCADACLAEEAVAELRKCIRTNLDCAAVCQATAEILTRQTAPDWSLLSAQLQACGEACHTCATECERHAKHMEHCRLCMETCRSCASTCQRMREAIKH